MNKKTITYFGEIDIDSDDFFSTKIILDDNNTTISICTSDTKLTDVQIADYEKYAEKLLQYKPKIDKAIAKDLKEEGSAFEYLEHLLEELDEITIKKILKNTDPEKTQVEQLHSLLKLNEIIFNPNNDEYAIWIYSLGDDITNYQLNIYTNKEGNVTGLAMVN